MELFRWDGTKFPAASSGDMYVTSNVTITCIVESKAGQCVHVRHTKNDNGTDVDDNVSRAGNDKHVQLVSIVIFYAMCVVVDDDAHTAGICTPLPLSVSLTSIGL